MAVEELVELKFRLDDGSDIGPIKYSSSTTVGFLKEKIIAQWPKDKENRPKSINDLKLINAGMILENNRTLGELRLPLTEVPGGVITMHVVVRPPLFDKNTGLVGWQWGRFEGGALSCPAKTSKTQTRSVPREFRGGAAKTHPVTCLDFFVPPSGCLDEFFLRSG